jgi:hypothetical protein
MASWALRNFAADTIFIADVICLVEFIDVIRARISFKFAIILIDMSSSYIQLLPSSFELVF